MVALRIKYWGPILISFEIPRSLSSENIAQQFFRFRQLSLKAPKTIKQQQQIKKYPHLYVKSLSLPLSTPTRFPLLTWTFSKVSCRFHFCTLRPKRFQFESFLFCRCFQAITVDDRRKRSHNNCTHCSAGTAELQLYLAQNEKWLFRRTNLLFCLSLIITYNCWWVDDSSCFPSQIIQHDFHTSFYSGQLAQVFYTITWSEVTKWQKFPFWNYILIACRYYLPESALITTPISMFVA